MNQEAQIPGGLKSIMMEPFRHTEYKSSNKFLITALILLVVGMLFGLTGGLQYIIPGIFKTYLSFEKTRPLHVSSVVFWIIMASTGTVIAYLQQYSGRKLFSVKLVKIQYYLFLISILGILTSYCYGIFGGREYWEFHPAFAVPITLGWILFIVNILKSAGSLADKPVYIWMWLTGVIFFLFTYIESNLWLIPYFGKHVIKDMTIQWKSYGSMVGSWNMLIYGSSIFLMEKISGNNNYSRSPIAFILYFTGFFNLMFNWGHHIYTLPTFPYIQYVSYAVSMTELFIFGRIIYLWRSSVNEARKHVHLVSYRFLISADIWIFLTLLLAILMSVPAINVYTHGTHITVAHTMGATIGINSLLLMAFVFDILHVKSAESVRMVKWTGRGIWVINISLFIFWICLVTAGIIKAKWQMSEVQIPFSTMMMKLRPLFILFFISGLTMFTGFVLIIYPILKGRLACYFNNYADCNKTEEQFIVIQETDAKPF